MNRRDFVALTFINLLYPKTALSRLNYDHGEDSYILLKLDDLAPNFGRTLSKEWEVVINFLLEKGVSASFGVISNLYDITDGAFAKRISEISQSSLFEFWNHGYVIANNIKQFKDNDEDQFNKLNEAQSKIKELVGYHPRFFGPHGGNKNTETFVALNRISEIKGVWFYQPPHQFQDRFFVIPRTIDAEVPIFNPHSESIFSHLYRYKINALQFHPAKWNDSQFEVFCEIILTLKKQAVKFILPSKFL